ncbi:MAG: PBP1A family penicillin-binding protein, partial [Desulfuromonas sp.]|nr:PBP1A family penicillin-binding protein [Desulfuromonas sp.]
MNFPTRLPRWGRFLLYGGATATLIVFATLVAAYLYVASTLPKVDTLADYRPPVITRILSDNGSTIAEIYDERRIVVPVARMPRRLIEAFVSAEDSNFFKHGGIDLVSIVRAAGKNLLAGGVVQGGSTITQQVTKSLLLTPERSFERKFKEAILAYRIENRLSKEEILYLYLNQIFLGHGAYGVQSAAENYFAKNVEQLNLAECSLLAGLPRAPSRYSPYNSLKLAKDRQRYVLERMVEEKYITAAEADAAFKLPLTIQSRRIQSMNAAAFFSEQVRRDLEAAYGREQLYRGGLEVRTSLNLAQQVAAQKAVRDNLREYDKRHGYRGPLGTLDPAAESKFLSEQTEEFIKAPPIAGDIVEAVVTGSDGQGGVMVRFGGHQGQLLRKETAWAGSLQVPPRGATPSGNAKGVGSSRLPVGSRLLVRILEPLPTDPWPLALEQDPEAEGVLLALDPRSGLIKAMVGGYDFRRSQFNRVLQARRQPGSAMKPLIYAAALDKGFTPATVVLDAPLIFRFRQPNGVLKEWAPQNYSREFAGPTTVRQALAKSNNIVTIRILQEIGVRYAADYARQLGITSPLQEDLTLALGSSAVTPLELATAYATLANGGIRVTPTYITQVRDRDGKILESINPADFPAGLQAGQRLVERPRTRAISPETAYLITSLMESVIQNGTGGGAKALGRPVAGKTGTTNELRDAWFVGSVPQLLALTWIGYDQERSLGHLETGGHAALPAWLAFMQEAVAPLPVENFPVPDSIEFQAIDPDSGRATSENAGGAMIEAFAPGSGPNQCAASEALGKIR